MSLLTIREDVTFLKFLLITNSLPYKKEWGNCVRFGVDCVAGWGACVFSLLREHMVHLADMSVS